MPTPKPPRRTNRARCRKCGTIIESRSLHDFVWCPCGAIAVDGGLEYRRRLGDVDDIEELSEGWTQAYYPPEGTDDR